MKIKALKALLFKMSKYDESSIWSDDRDDAARDLLNMAQDAFNLLNSKVPNSAGIWEWFDINGDKHLVAVIKAYRDEEFYSVYYNGGYYSVEDRTETSGYRDEWSNPAQWPNSWGVRIGSKHEINEDDILYYVEDITKLWGEDESIMSDEEFKRMNGDAMQSIK